MADMEPTERAEWHDHVMALAADNADLRSAVERLTRERDEAFERTRERAAKVAEARMTCGCGRGDCYTDRVPEAIAAAIRALETPDAP